MYGRSPDTIPELGTEEYEVTFTPADTKNYESVTGAVSVTVTDTVAPLIQGVTNGAVYCEAQTVTVSDRHLAAVTVKRKRSYPGRKRQLYSSSGRWAADYYCSR